LRSTGRIAESNRHRSRGRVISIPRRPTGRPDIEIIASTTTNRNCTGSSYTDGIYTACTYNRILPAGMYLHSHFHGHFYLHSPSHTRSRIHHRRRSTSYETRSGSEGSTMSGAKHRSVWIQAGAEWLRSQASCKYRHIPSTETIQGHILYNPILPAGMYLHSHFHGQVQTITVR
jgi:hypothetical protein